VAPPDLPSSGPGHRFRTATRSTRSPRSTEGTSTPLQHARVRGPNQAQKEQPVQMQMQMQVRVRVQAQVRVHELEPVRPMMGWGWPCRVMELQSWRSHAAVQAGFHVTHHRVLGHHHPWRNWQRGAGECLLAARHRLRTLATLG